MRCRKTILVDWLASSLNLLLLGPPFRFQNLFSDVPKPMLSTSRQNIILNSSLWSPLSLAHFLSFTTILSPHSYIGFRPIPGSDSLQHKVSLTKQQHRNSDKFRKLFSTNPQPGEKRKMPPRKHEPSLPAAVFSTLKSFTHTTTIGNTTLTTFTNSTSNSTKARYVDEVCSHHSNGSIFPCVSEEASHFAFYFFPIFIGVIALMGLLAAFAVWRNGNGFWNWTEYEMRRSSTKKWKLGFGKVKRNEVVDNDSEWDESDGDADKTEDDAEKQLQMLRRLAMRKYQHHDEKERKFLKGLMTKKCIDRHGDEEDYDTWEIISEAMKPQAYEKDKKAAERELKVLRGLVMKKYQHHDEHNYNSFEIMSEAMSLAQDPASQAQAPSLLAQDLGLDKEEAHGYEADSEEDEGGPANFIPDRSERAGHEIVAIEMKKLRAKTRSGEAERARDRREGRLITLLRREHEERMARRKTRKEQERDEREASTLR